MLPLNSSFPKGFSFIDAEAEELLVSQVSPLTSKGLSHVTKPCTRGLGKTELLDSL